MADDKTKEPNVADDLDDYVGDDDNGLSDALGACHDTARNLLRALNKFSYSRTDMHGDHLKPLPTVVSAAYMKVEQASELLLAAAKIHDALASDER